MNKVQPKTIISVLIISILFFGVFSCSDSENIAILSAPKNKTERDKFVNKFNDIYNTSSGLNFAPIKIDVSDQSDGVILNIMTSQSVDNKDGLVFHYGLSSDLQTLCYLVGKGSEINNTKTFTYTYFPANTNGVAYDHFIKLSSEVNSYSPIRVDELESYKLRYSQNMRREYFLGLSNPVCEIDNHPNVIFHKRSEIIDFFQEFSNKSQLHLYIFPGAGKTAEVSKKFHLPIFQFGSSSSLFHIDDDVNPNRRYEDKAFNAGQLCPPLCYVQTNYLCPNN